MTLQIEEGKYYVSKAGVKVGPMIPHRANVFYGKGHTCIATDGKATSYHQKYRCDGQVYMPQPGEEDHELVAEWVDEPAAEALAILTPDPVDRPAHYTGHPSGVECIQITEHMNFCRGNAIKYIWRAGEKGDEIEDLKKAAWYIQREIARLEK